MLRPNSLVLAWCYLKWTQHFVYTGPIANGQTSNCPRLPLDDLGCTFLSPDMEFQMHFKHHLPSGSSSLSPWYQVETGWSLSHLALWALNCFVVSCGFEMLPNDHWKSEWALSKMYQFNQNMTVGCSHFLIFKLVAGSRLLWPRDWANSFTSFIHSLIHASSQCSYLHDNEL